MDEKQVPPSVKEWEGQIAAEEVGDNTIRSIELNSTSNIRYSRYLHLRVLRKQKKPMDFNPKDFDLDRWKHQADEKLASYELWRTYLDNFNYPDDIKEGGFMIATHHQRQSAKVQTNAVTPNTFLSPVAGRTRSKIHHNPTETPSKSTGEPADLASTMDRLGFGGESRPETPVETPENLNTPISWTPESSIVPKELQRILYQETEDEQIVNAALLEFTNALTILFRLSNMWSFHRKPLVAKFKKASLEARLDGYLRDEQSRKIRAIIEVKAAWRYQRLRQIFMQESAQMVAWIMNDPSIDLATNRRGR